LRKKLVFEWVKLTRRFRRKTKSGFCVCAITFQMQYTNASDGPTTHIFSVVSAYQTTWRYFT